MLLHIYSVRFSNGLANLFTKKFSIWFMELGKILVEECAKVAGNCFGE